MKEIKTFSHLLKLQDLFQQVNQLSWTIQNFKKEYPRLDKMSPEQHLELIEFYHSLINKVEKIYEEIKYEKQQYESRVD